MNRKRAVRRMESKGPAFLFDLDGTLVESVYQHVLAWRGATRLSKPAWGSPCGVFIAALG